MNIYGEQLEFLQRSSGTGQLAFSPRHIANLPNIGETDIFRSLQLLPGIQMGNTGFAGLYIRGGTPDQNQIILDGMSIYQVDHFFGFFSAINSNIVKDVQVYKGGFPAKYGGRIASVIDITGKSGSTKQQKFDLFTNMLSAGITYEQPLSKRSSFILSVRRSFTDQYQTKLYDNIHDFLTSGSGLNIGAELPSDTISYESEYLPNFYFYDINGKFTYLPKTKISFQFHFMKARIIWVKKRILILNQILWELSKLWLMNKQNGVIQVSGQIGYVAGPVQQKPNCLWQRQDTSATMT
ncbi:MAG: hypothetical protein CM1200mP10_01050 [Candidatus Neomarinimicrobiota bacterium]|nr:MAG: hypothetical protein CM1200mP10_01050 [Candidatus Neomarinimicrobiota bacterium]